MVAPLSRRAFLATTLAAGGVLVVGGLDGERLDAQSIPDADRFLGLVEESLGLTRHLPVPMRLGQVG